MFYRGGELGNIMFVWLFMNCFIIFHRLSQWNDNNLNRTLFEVTTLDSSSFPIAQYEPLEKLKPHPLKWLSANAIDLYFNDRMAGKGNEKGRRLFMCGFLKNCTFHQNGDDIYFCAMSCAEMKKTKDYEVRAHINCLQCDIMKAQCQCPAGQGFSAACKHVSALMYAIEYYAVTGSSRMFLL